MVRVPKERPSSIPILETPLSSFESILPLHMPVSNVTVYHYRPNAGLEVGDDSPRDLRKDRLLCFSSLRVKTLHWPFQALASSQQHRLGGHWSLTG